jgi:hypothetical protein
MVSVRPGRRIVRYHQSMDSPPRMHTVRTQADAARAGGPRDAAGVSRHRTLP